MTTDLSTHSGRFFREVAGALFGFDRHHLMDIFHRDQGTRLASVARLAATTAPTAGAFGA